MESSNKGDESELLKAGCLFDHATAVAKHESQVCSEGEGDICTTADAEKLEVQSDPKWYWCPLKFRTETIVVRKKEEDTVETVVSTIHGPIVTSALLSSEDRLQETMVSLNSPLLKERISIGQLKMLNSASTTNDVLASAKEGSKGSGRILFASKQQVGHIGFGDEVGEATVQDKGLIATSRHAQAIRRVEELLKQKLQSSAPDVEFNRLVQCDAKSESVFWFAEFVLQALGTASSHASTATEAELSAKDTVIQLLKLAVSSKDNTSPEFSAAAVFLEVLIVTMKRSVLAPLQRDPDINRNFYSKKDYSTLRGSASYKQMLSADSTWLFRLLDMGLTNSSLLLNGRGGLDEFVWKSVSDAMQTAEKFYGPPKSWSFDSIHTSFISRSARFPFTPAGVDFNRALHSGPYKLPGGTDSVFQNGYESSLEEKPTWNHPLASKFCLRTSFRFVCLSVPFSPVHVLIFLCLNIFAEWSSI